MIVLRLKIQRTASLSRREKTAAARQTDTILPFDVFGVKISINGGGAEGGGRIPRVFCALHRVSYFSHNDLDLWIRGVGSILMHKTDMKKMWRNCLETLDTGSGADGRHDIRLLSDWKLTSLLTMKRHSCIS